MRVVVTGATGMLGRVAVALLLEHGFEVTAVDRVAERLGPLQCRLIDLTDLGQVYGVLAGTEAVLHLGAIPAPGMHPPETIFQNNVMGFYNVCEAAAVLGIPRIVSASSVSALGFPWQHRWSEPLYLPIDEDHPLLPQDCYGLSKAVGEEIAAAYCRRTTFSAASLRFSTILRVDQRQEWFASVQSDPGRFAHLLWSYVDVRDAADACRLALTAAYQGHQPFYITAPDTNSELPTLQLRERYFPAVPLRAIPTGEGVPLERWSLLVGTRARDILGYKANYLWQEAVSK